ncbi:MAG TPA: hypothetical protein H9683_06655 [Firmicutes bacterium]|nr:hypothetical protein [Bacillota bacterium]
MTDLETQNPENGGYRSGNKVVGFGQLYSQGTGGVQSYGNFLRRIVRVPAFHIYCKVFGYTNKLQF